MKEVIQAFNQLKEEKLISDYAIGGGVATIFYVEPIDTIDIDIFVLMPQRSSFIRLDSIYSSLMAKGYQPENEYIKIGDSLVQILVPPSLLEEEAVREAREVTYQEINCKVLKAEHLIAICLQVGRARDYYKASLLLEQASLDMDLLHTIISRYNLETQWNKLTQV